MMATRSSIVNLKAICGLLNANLPTMSWILDDSVRSVFRNLRRAGVLKNNSFTSIVVPGAEP